MTASENRLIHFAQKSLLVPGAFAALGLLGPQAVIAQAEPGAVELSIPQPAAPSPAAPAPTVVTPEVVVPVTPSPVVPATIETAEPPQAASSEPAVDYGAVFVEPTDGATPSIGSLLEDNQPAAGETPSVEVILPSDYGAAQVDPTDYSVGATMPDVVISERSSGCEYSLDTGSAIASAACHQVNRLTDAIAATPGQSGRVAAFSNLPGVQAVGLTTAASRDFYNQAAQAVVQLQQGQKFVFPLSMPAPLTSLFGWRMHPIFGVRRFHSGTDVGAPLGTPVVATQSGQVVTSDYAGGYGLMVILHHNDGTLESRYAHLSRLLVQVGEWVEQGEVIGLVGSTGNSTGPHLHFELRQLTDSGWTVLNPDSLLRQTLGTLAQALGNSLTAFAGTAETAQATPNEAVSLEGLPFRPAQPHAN
ncbi:MAG: M23 family metallopeptidase [Leptolyngbyaceae cyanobacterium]